jgi:hypothetical protein
MDKFLEKTAEYIYEKYSKDEVSELCILLPNRRGGLYLKKYLSERYKANIWAPAVFSIEDFLVTLSGFKISESLHVLFQLYEVHKRMEGKEAQSFEEFVSWGQQLLQDFNEIDSYLADPEQVFGYLSDARALSLWNLDQKPLTDFQKNYLKFYKSLYSYYQQLTAGLLERKEATTGLLSRYVAENISSLRTRLPWKYLLFAGFNALSKSEEVIIDTLYKENNAQLLWDSDEYYQDDNRQEAGDFLRKWRKKWGDGGFSWVGNRYASQAKKIEITGVPFSIGQVKYCGEVLSKLQGDKEDTAVVLMDEKLLIPLLNSLPENIEALNITMGLPLRQSPFFTLFDSLFQMHENVGKFRKSKSVDQPRFYFRDVVKVLQHSLMVQLSETSPHNVSRQYDELIVTVRSAKRILWKREDLLPGGEDLFRRDLEFLEPVFSLWEKPEEALQSIIRLIAFLKDSKGYKPKVDKLAGVTEPADIELEYLFAFSKVTHQLASLIREFDSVKSLKSLHLLFNRIAESTSLPFHGEPLKGLQVMGMLETRTLDFRNLVLLSTNEDLIPSGKAQHSFIPFDIRRDFALPTHHYKNAVYAYHFYRLLQRAETVHLLYNTEPDELGGGERSRFIKQIQLELPAYNKNVEITEQVLTTQPAGNPLVAPIVVMKDEDILQALKKTGSSGLAPTALNGYRKCRLRFYFSQVAGLKEPEEQSETIEPQVLGQAVHDVLHQLFKPFIGKVLTSDAYRSMLPLIDNYANIAFEKFYTSADLAYGKNLLLVNVGKIMVANYLKEEIRAYESGDPGTLAGSVRLLEQKVHHTLQVAMRGEMFPVKIKGYIDRVDQVGAVLRIMDYKTGFADKKELTVDDWDDFALNPEMDKSFQLLTYTWLVHKAFTNPEEPQGKEEGRVNLVAPDYYEAGIISLKKISNGFMSTTLPGCEPPSKIDPPALDQFEAALQQILEEIFDPARPFDQTDDLEICSRCPYINLCGR